MKKIMLSILLSVLYTSYAAGFEKLTDTCGSSHGSLKRFVKCSRILTNGEKQYGSGECDCIADGKIDGTTEFRWLGFCELPSITYTETSGGCSRKCTVPSVRTTCEGGEVNTEPSCSDWVCECNAGEKKYITREGECESKVKFCCDNGKWSDEGDILSSVKDLCITEPEEKCEEVTCNDTQKECQALSSRWDTGTATRKVTKSCGTCEYGVWNTSNCKEYQYYWELVGWNVRCSGAVDENDIRHTWWGEPITFGVYDYDDCPPCNKENYEKKCLVNPYEKAWFVYKCDDYRCKRK